VLLGNSATGKKVFAASFTMPPYAHLAFPEFNCAATLKDTISELFGHEPTLSPCPAG
jgi:transcriptional regulator with GAF, ATPase, and Fis domain